MGFCATFTCVRSSPLTDAERGAVSVWRGRWDPDAVVVVVAPASRDDGVILGGRSRDLASWPALAEDLAELARRLGAELLAEDDLGLVSGLRPPELPEEVWGWSTVGARPAPAGRGVHAVPSHRSLRPDEVPALAAELGELDADAILTAFDEDRGPEWRANLRTALAPLAAVPGLAGALARRWWKRPRAFQRDVEILRLLGESDSDEGTAGLVALIRDGRVAPERYEVAPDLRALPDLALLLGRRLPFATLVLTLASSTPWPTVWAHFAARGQERALPLLDRILLRPTLPTRTSVARSASDPVALAVLRQWVDQRARGHLTDGPLADRLGRLLAAPELVVRHAAAREGARLGLPSFGDALARVDDEARRAGVEVPSVPAQRGSPLVQGFGLGAGPTRPTVARHAPAPLGTWQEDLASLEPARCAQGLARIRRARHRVALPDPAPLLALQLYDEVAALLALPRVGGWKALGVGVDAAARAAWFRTAVAPPDLPAILRDTLEHGPEATARALPLPEPVLVLSAAERADWLAEEDAWLARARWR